MALLLVTKACGDTAAVTMKISISAITFYYAKNGPHDPSAQVYVDKILTVLRENELNAIPKSVLMIVMVECVEKVRNRIKKCQVAFKEFEKLSILYANTLKPWAGLNDSEILRSFFKGLRDQYYYTTPPYSYHSVSNTVIGVGKALIQYPTLHRRIQKFGAYFAPAMEIRGLLKRREYRKLVSNIRFTEIIPPAQQIVQIPKSICTLLNEDAAKKDQGHVTAQDSNAKFPELCTETTENATVTTPCHCELTLVPRALESKCSPTSIKIGVSKRICWLCEQYLDLLSRDQNVRLLLSEYQGKRHAGWQIPENTREDVK